LGQQQFDMLNDEYLLQLWKMNLVSVISKSKLQNFDHATLTDTFLTIKLEYLRNCFAAAMEKCFPRKLALIKECQAIRIVFSMPKALSHFGIRIAWIDICTGAIINALIDSITSCEIKGTRAANPKLRNRKKGEIEAIIDFLLRGDKAENRLVLPANIDKVRKDFLAVCREHLDTIGGDELSRLSESFADGRIVDQLNRQMLEQLFLLLESQRSEDPEKIDNLISSLLDTCSGELVVPQNGDPYEESKMEVAGFQDRANQDPGKVVEVLRPGVRYKSSDLLKAVVELSS
jgi:hypothetical protein